MERYWMYFDFNRLISEEERENRKKMKKSARGKELLAVLDRLFIEGLVCIISAIIVLACIFIFALEAWYYALVGLLLFGGIIFIVSQYNIRKKEYAKLSITKINNKKKK